MLENKGSLAWQGDEDHNVPSGQFLQEIDYKIHKRGYTSEVLMVKCMHNNIVYGSGTNIRFSSLSQSNTTTYDLLVTAFKH